MNNIHHYNHIIRQLRKFFQDKKGFIEVPTQARTSILAACEDPKTITTYSIGGTEFPLPQTGQMWLEHELLRNPGLPGFFCVTTSYRDEPNIIEGRHRRVFPLFEFESHGNMEDLKDIEAELLEFLGFKTPIALNYENLCKQYNANLLEAPEEEKMWQDHGNGILLQNFPFRSHPYWNMKHNKDGIYNKVDVIMYGMETIGSAERSCNAEEMRNDFFTTSDGGYAQLLFDKFGKNRVMKELDEYFALPGISTTPRYGGGIGVTRLERAMELAGLFEATETYAATHPQTQPTPSAPAFADQVSL